MLFDALLNQYCFVFANGSVVTWGVKRHQINGYIQLVRPFATGLAKTIIQDEFFYQAGEVTSIKPHPSFNLDCITLASDDTDLKLSLAYGFAQSIKLKYYEHFLENLAREYSPLLHTLGKKRPRIDRTKVRQIISQLLIAKSQMNLVEDTLYQPKFFWQHPNLEKYYLMLERYLDLPKRVDALNQQFNTLNEVFDMLNAYLEHKHSSFLEIVIIVLIVAEIFFQIVNWHF